MTFIIAILLLFSPVSFAGGDWIGNGGSGVYCESSKEIQVLDYYEGTTTRGLAPDLGDEKLLYSDKVQIALERLSQVNPSRARMYQEWYQDFAGEVSWFSDGDLIPVPDTGPVVLPEHCKLVQIAAQRPDNQILPGDKRYIINAVLWSALSETQKAGLILHELIYREAIQVKEGMSAPKVRYFNQWISSAKILSLSPVEFFDMVKTSGLDTVDYYGYNIFVKSAYRYAVNGPVTSARMAFSDGFYAAENTWAPLSGRLVEFHRNGALKSFPLTDRDYIEFSVGKNTLPFRGCPNVESRIEMYDDGSLAKGPLLGQAPFESNGQKVLIQNKNCQVEFTQDGKVKPEYILKASG